MPKPPRRRNPVTSVSHAIPFTVRERIARDPNGTYTLALTKAEADVLAALVASTEQHTIGLMSPETRDLVAGVLATIKAQLAANVLRQRGEAAKS